jgi:Fe-S-cluster containining protein
MNSKTARVFACRRCGQCCRVPGYVYLTAADVDRIAAFLGMAVEAFTARYTRLAPQRSGLSLTETGEGACIFLDARGDCAIQAVKPEQCDAFPGTWRYLMMDTVCEGWGK